MQEIQIPLQAKFSFNRESNNLFSPYVMIGYHLRFLLPANVRVSNEGNQVSKKDENLKFRNKLFVEQI
jgi:hypothetical protein